MKLASIIIFFVALGLSISNTPNQIEQIKLAKNKSLMGRKISINNRKNLMLVGLWNYKKNVTSRDFEITSAEISFDAHFIRNKNFPYYKKMNLSTTIKLKNDTNLEHIIECTHTIKNVNETYELKDLYYECNLDILKNNLQKLDTLIPKKNFKFYNSTDIYRNVAEGEIDESSFAEETINYLENQNKTIKYDII